METPEDKETANRYLEAVQLWIAAVDECISREYNTPDILNRAELDRLSSGLERIRKRAKTTNSNLEAENCTFSDYGDFHEGLLSFARMANTADVWIRPSSSCESFVMR
jgi:hypothetical protein